jgi:hypothetical protein
MLPGARLFAVSIVYNFRIAQITKQPIAEPSEKKHSIIALLIDMYQKKYSGVFQNFIGGLGAFIYNWDSYYIRVDSAAAHIREVTCHVTDFKDTETDDILFTCGRNFKINDRATITCSGLFGVPTHSILRLRHVDFGTGQIGLGLQCDGTYATECGSLIFGGRYIHFFPGDARDTFGFIHRFSIGNVGDVLFAFRTNGKKHGVELGYTSRWQFGARCFPTIENIIERTNYERNNFYTVYKYKFATESVNHRLLYYIAYGFDRKPKTFGNKHVVTLWTSWNGRF